MSFVVGFATRNYGIIASDGRAVKDGKILTEHYDKTRKVGKAIVGFTGEALLGEEALINSHLATDAPVSDVSRSLCEYLLNQNLSHDRTCNFVVIGPNENNQMELHSFGTGSGLHVDARIADEENLQYATLASAAVKNSSQLFVQQLSKPRKNIKSALIDTIHCVANLDDSVNENVFLQEISL